MTCSAVLLKLHVFDVQIMQFKSEEADKHLPLLKSFSVNVYSSDVRLCSGNLLDDIVL